MSLDLAKKRIAITGIGGFIGARLSTMAQERGALCQGLEIDPGAAERARQSGAEVVVGSVTDPDAVRRAVGGAHVVVHAAALVREGGDFSEARLVNVGGTELVASEARRHGATQFIHLSSVMVYGFDFPPDVDEDGPLRGENNPYCATKVESEIAARSFATDRFGVTVVRPGDVYGPACVPWVIRPLSTPAGLPLFVPSKTAIFNHLFVDNLCSALLQIVGDEIVGETLNLTDGGGIPFFDWFDRLAGWQGRRAKVMDPRVMRGLLAIAERAARVAGKPFVESDVVGFLSRPHRYGISRAQRVLGNGWNRVGFEEGVAMTEAWARMSQLAPPSSGRPPAGHA